MLKSKLSCAIIEDEQLVAAYLESLLLDCEQEIEVLAKLDSVHSAIEWLKSNEVDLLFLDVQLGDGLVFNIFDNIQLDTPVIFTTSYNEYAIKAFELNSISYLLKPINRQELQSALNKFHTWYEPLSNKIDVIHREINPYQKRFLVQSGSVLKSITEENISYFHVQGRHLLITDKDGSQYLFDQTLEAIESRLDPSLFFRINRQYIVSYNFIDKMLQFTRGRLKVVMEPAYKDEMIVSIDRAVDFKTWLNR